MDFLLTCSERVQEPVFFSVAHLLNLEVDVIFFDTTTADWETEASDEAGDEDQDGPQGPPTLTSWCLHRVWQGARPLGAASPVPARAGGRWAAVRCAGTTCGTPPGRSWPPTASAWCRSRTRWATQPSRPPAATCTHVRPPDRRPGSRGRSSHRQRAPGHRQPPKH